MDFTRIPLAGRSVARVATAALFALLAACGGGDAPAPTTPPSSASATIGAAGGTLDGPDGSRVVIPPGALAADTTIGIARRDTGAPADGPDGYTRRGATYEFTPHDIAFAQPVTLRIPVAAGAAANDESVFRASADGAIWEGLGQTTAGGFAEWPSSGFSWYAYWACAYTGTPADPYPCVGTSGFTTVTPTPANALTLTSANPQAAHRFYNVSQETTLLLDASYSAPADCGDARIAFKRRRTGATQAEVLQDTPATVSASGAQRIRATASFNVALTNADNGRTLLISAFSCRRAYQSPARAHLSPAQQRTGAFDVMVFNARIPAPPAAIVPQITLQPAAVSVTAPAAATFNAGASGTPAADVQWQRSNDDGATWTNIGGATAPSYTLAATAVGDHGALFRAVFTNSAGSATTSAAPLTVAAPPSASTPMTTLATGWKHNCAVNTSGRVACWGHNGSAQIGETGGSAFWPTPFIWTLPEAAVSVATGRDASCAVTVTGLVYCAGIGLNGGLRGPMLLAGFAGVRQVVIGSSQLCLLAADRTVWCRGGNSVGELGNGGGAGSSTPVQVQAAGGGALDGVVALAAGYAHTCAVLQSGTVACWGYNAYGQAGAAPGTNVLVATPTGLAGAAQIAAGNHHTCARLAGGGVECWGLNLSGQFGNGSTAGSGTASPSAVSGIATAAWLGSGELLVCTSLADGSVRCWGTGSMGNGNVSETRLAPTLVSGLGSVVALGVGFEHACALRSTGVVVCWGAGGSGQLGQGDSMPRLVPTAVPNLTVAQP